MQNLQIIVICSLFFFSCANEQAENKQEISSVNTDSTRIEKSKTCSLEDSLKLYYKLVNVKDINPDIRVRLRYSGSNNFLKTDVYECLENAYLTPLAADKLAIAQNLLSAKDSTLHLLIWDAVRPLSIQWKMWYLLKMPLAEKVRYVSNPRNGSIHNYGCAVDLTICNEKGEILDMGTDFDHFGRAANIHSEGNLLTEGILNYYQVDNRKLLRKVMKEAGFTTISSEWWHFNAISRDSAAKKYTIVE